MKTESIDTHKHTPDPTRSLVQMISTQNVQCSMVPSFQVPTKPTTTAAAATVATAAVTKKMLQKENVHSSI